MVTPIALTTPTSAQQQAQMSALLGSGPESIRGPNGEILSRRDAEIWAAAQSLESSFLSLMLENAGVGAAPSEFGGGAGEEHFASFLRDAQANEMVQAGGIGLAESLFDAMKEHADV